jgi:hypothetical protein
MTTNALVAPSEAWNATVYNDGWKKTRFLTGDVTEQPTGAKLRYLHGKEL